jgi:hypothetical protein
MFVDFENFNLVEEPYFVMIKKPCPLSLSESVVALFFKVFFTQKYIKIIFFIFKKLFFTPVHQNDLKHKKKFNKKN